MHTYLKNFTHKEFEEAIIGGGACEPQKWPIKGEKGLNPSLTST